MTCPPSQDNSSKDCSDRAEGRPQALSDILNDMDELADQGNVSVGDMVKAFETRGFGPLLLLPALLAILPVVGALPAVSILTALAEIAFSAQLLAGATQPWLPGNLREISIEGDKLSAGLKKIRPWARRIERVTSPRLTGLVNGGAGRLSGLAAFIIAIAMLFGAMVPGAIVPPAVAMILFALGLTSKDGLLVLAAYMAIGIVIGLAFWFLAF